MSGHSVKGAIAYKIAIASDVSDMAKFLGDCFSTREPPAVAAGFSAEKIAQLVKVFCSNPKTLNLSMVARDTSTGEMVGALLASDYAAPPPEGIEPLVPTFAPLLAFLGQLDDQYNAVRTITEGQTVHIFMIASAAERIGAGIAGELLRRCLSNGAKRGFQSAVAEATSAASRGLLRKHGFDELFFAKYEDFELDGSRPFASIKDHVGCALMEVGILAND